MSWSVRNASHTTYALRDTPSQIRITNPIHPLRERTLEVVYSRRQGRETHWIVRLPDGSCAQIPSAWTDHPRGVVPTERLRAGGRATPESLRISSGCWAVWSIQPRIRQLVHVWVAQETHMSKQLLLF